MSDLLAILSRGSSSLAAHRAASATASHNLQNANTPGFARQRAELEAVRPAEFLGRGWIGRGVSLGAISQARDRFLEWQLPGAFSARARSSAESEALASVSALDPDAAGGLSSALGDFYASLRGVAQNPGDLNLRQGAVSAARKLALAFNRSAAALETARTGIDAKLGGVMDEANRAASAVADLNRQIRLARATGAEPNDLLDARQRALDTLARLVGGTPVPDGGGDVHVILPGGGGLVSGDRAARLSLAADPANGGHLAVYLTPVDGSAATAVPASALGGTVGGLLEARDGALKTALGGLDQLAFDLASRWNEVHQAGFGLDGQSGRVLFAAPSGVDGAARRLAVDPGMIADPRRLAAAGAAEAVPGDATNLYRLIATEAEAVSGGLTPGQALSQVISQFGASAARARSVAEHDEGILGHLETMRESVSGVSIDEELVNLTKAQRAFEAVMKVIATADEMLETLMKLK